VNPEPVESTEAQVAQERRVAFESLRERTDELELIISGISLLALLALPGWLLERWVQVELHAEGQWRLLLALGFQLASGLSMTLSCAFLLHLAVRAYWVGLIGLKASFPAGIRWDGIRSIGPITRDYYRRTVVDLDKAIDAADRVASIVFAFASLVTLSILWIGGLFCVLSLVGMGFAALIGHDFAAQTSVGVYLFITLTAFVMLPIFVLDGRWWGSPSEAAPWRRAIIERLARLQGILFPQRVALPVQLALESNMPRGTFTVMFMLLIFATALFSSVQERAVRQFALVSSYTYFGNKDADVGLRSAHYENLRGERDVLARVPMIPADMIADGHLRLFLPYVPERDNGLLRARCASADEAASRRDCLAGLWEVTLDEKPVDLAAFVAAERRDIGLRGLQGYLALSGLAPGAHVLRARWNTAGANTAKPIDYRIPFWFSPPYQQDLAPVAR
jgi:hypothetical protein